MNPDPINNHPADQSFEKAFYFYTQNQLERSKGICAALLRGNDHDVKVLNLLGVILCRQERHDEGIALMRRAIELMPTFSDAHFNLAKVYLRSGQLAAAAAAGQKAVETSTLSPEAHNLLGLINQKLGLSPEAATCYRRATEIAPDFAEAWFNLGFILMEQGDLQGSAACYLTILRHNPKNAEACHNLGNILLEQLKAVEAVEKYREALAINPDFADPRISIGNIRLAEGLLEEAIAEYRTVISLATPYPEATSNLLLALNYDPDITDEELFTAHRDWEKRHGLSPNNPDSSFANNPTPDRPLKIGYVSADFRQHPIGFFLLPVIRHHDRKLFTTYCYSGVHKPDDYTSRFREASDFWRITSGVDDAHLAEMIRNDGIDILVDLAGHTGWNRLVVFSGKPAPLQMTWAGYVGSTGLSAMDYLISDRIESPEGAEKFCSERIMRLPDGYLCYEPPTYAPEVGSLPADRNGFITFGCFNNLAKVRKETVALWSRILHRLPGSRLVMKATGLGRTHVRKRYFSLFEEGGIPRSRIDLVPVTTHLEHLSWYNRIDIALDPLTYSGGLTTLEALWMGVPVVTLPGSRFCSRHTATHLNTVGLNELIANSCQDYLDIACALATDRERLGALRSGLRQRMKASPVCNHEHFTRSLETAYREAWRQWCANRLIP